MGVSALWLLHHGCWAGMVSPWWILLAEKVGSLWLHVAAFYSMLHALLFLNSCFVTAPGCASTQPCISFLLVCCLFQLCKLTCITIRSHHCA
jgi:hypothetical protein